MKLSRIAFRNIFRNTKRSIFSVTAIIVATGAVLFMFSFIDGMLSETERNAKVWMTGNISIQHVLYKENERLNPLHYNLDIDNMENVLQGVQGIKGILPRLSFPSLIYDKTTTLNHAAFGIGMDLAKEEDYTELSKNLVTGSLPDPGEKEAVIGAGLAEKLNKKVGDKFTTFTQTVYRSQNGATYRITGIIKYPLPGMNTSTFIIPLDRAQRLLKMRGKTKEFLVFTEPNVKETKVKENLLQKLPEKEYFLIAWFEDEMISMFAQAQGIYNVISFIFLVLAATVIMNTLMMVIFERIREIGTIGALGMKARNIIRLFLTEGFFMSIAGAIGGIILGLAFVIPLSQTGIHFGEDFQMGSVSFASTYPQVTINIVITVFLFSIAVSTLISFLAVRRSAKIKPVEALRQ